MSTLVASLGRLASNFLADDRTIIIEDWVFLRTRRALVMLNIRNRCIVNVLFGNCLKSERKNVTTWCAPTPRKADEVFLSKQELELLEPHFAQLSPISSPFLPSTSSSPSHPLQFPLSQTHLSAPILDTSLSIPLKKALLHSNIQQLHPVQLNAFLPLLQNEQDILLQAPCGSGKSIAYLLPILQRLLQVPPSSSDSPAQTGIKVLVLCPSRELVQQNLKAAANLTRFTPHIRSSSLCGGRPFEEDLQRLQEDRPLLLFATLGRLIHHLKRTDHFLTPLRSIQTLVLEDVSFFTKNSGSVKNVLYIKSLLPSFVTTWAVSSTVTILTERLWRRVLNTNFRYYSLMPTNTSEGVVSPLIRQYYCLYRSRDYFSTLCGLLRSVTGEGEERGGKVIVFFPTTSALLFFYVMLKHVMERPFFVGEKSGMWALHKRMTPEKRTRVVDLFHNAEKGILFSSDIGSMGMDFKNVTSVIQMGIASDTETYLHRVGRMGRGEGKYGKSILVLNELEHEFLSLIESEQGIQLEKMDNAPALGKDFLHSLPQRLRKMIAPSEKREEKLEKTMWVNETKQEAMQKHFDSSVSLSQQSLVLNGQDGGIASNEGRSDGREDEEMERRTGHTWSDYRQKSWVRSPHAERAKAMQDKDFKYEEKEAEEYDPNKRKLAKGQMASDVKKEKDVLAKADMGEAKQRRIMQKKNKGKDGESREENVKERGRKSKRGREMEPKDTSHEMLEEGNSKEKMRRKKKKKAPKEIHRKMECYWKNSPPTLSRQLNPMQLIKLSGKIHYERKKQKEMEMVLGSHDKKESTPEDGIELWEESNEGIIVREMTALGLISSEGARDNKEEVVKINMPVEWYKQTHLYVSATLMYRSLLGYYCSRISDLRIDRHKIPKHVNDMLSSMGLNTPPRVNLNFAKKFQLYENPNVLLSHHALSKHVLLASLPGKTGFRSRMNEVQSYSKTQRKLN